MVLCTERPYIGFDFREDIITSSYLAYLSKGNDENDVLKLRDTEHSVVLIAGHMVSLGVAVLVQVLLPKPLLHGGVEIARVLKVELDVPGLLPHQDEGSDLEDDHYGQLAEQGK